MTATDWAFQLSDHGKNNLEVKIAGKWFPLRVKTLHQMERYAEVLEQHKRKSEAIQGKERTPVEVMRDNLEAALDLCEIALNPTPAETPWPRERIREALDPDKIEILAAVWLERFLSPRVSADPSLAPRGAGR